ncbi:hypothetical protein MMC08_003657 [Hypocenomyce scalaris]|nr:hypothetical protein [Hypocenomyce scalaris]
MNTSRNIYKDDVDFQALALQSPVFAKHLKKNGQLDFSDPDAVQQLTKSLLKRDFNLELELPDDRLCPPVCTAKSILMHDSSLLMQDMLQVPNRLNYILWIQDLLDTTSDTFTDAYDPEREVVGLDISAPQVFLYPALTLQTPSHHTDDSNPDIDAKSLQYARLNIHNNNLAPRIRLLKTLPTDPLIPLAALGLDSLTFTLTNPPFYPTPSSLLASATLKSRPPNSACTGSPSEMITPGGESAFVRRLISESLLLRTRVQWYTATLGNLSSVATAVDDLRAAGATNWAVAAFVQGRRTRRWAVAWSWAARRPSVAVARAVPALPKHLLPFPSEFSVALPRSFAGHDLAARLNGVLAPLRLRWRYRPEIFAGVGFARGDVWSRAARRNERKLGNGQKVGSAEVDDGEDEGEEEEEEEEEEAALGFRIQLPPPSADTGEVLIRWLQGHQSVLFESFCGMLKRRLTSS